MNPATPHARNDKTSDCDCSRKVTGVLPPRSPIALPYLAQLWFRATGISLEPLQRMGIDRPGW